MPKKLYIVDLTNEQREELIDLTGKGKASARKLTRARILLKADEGWKDEQIVAALAGLCTIKPHNKEYLSGGIRASVGFE